jgi:hypothetical protein
MDQADDFDDVICPRQRVAAPWLKRRRGAVSWLLKLNENYRRVR